MGDDALARDEHGLGDLPLDDGRAVDGERRGEQRHGQLGALDATARVEVGPGAVADHALRDDTRERQQRLDELLEQGLQLRLVALLLGGEGLLEAVEHRPGVQ